MTSSDDCPDRREFIVKLIRESIRAHNFREICAMIVGARFGAREVSDLLREAVGCNFCRAITILCEYAIEYECATGMPAFSAINWYGALAKAIGRDCDRCFARIFDYMRDYGAICCVNWQNIAIFAINSDAKQIFGRMMRDCYEYIWEYLDMTILRDDTFKYGNQFCYALVVSRIDEEECKKERARHKFVAHGYDYDFFGDDV